MPPFTPNTILRGAARTSAQLLRTGAETLERLSGGGDQPRTEEPQQPAAGRRTASRGRAATTRRRTTRRADPQRSRAPKDLDDVTIARKVESVIFRVNEVAKGDISVNVADGIAYLRGEVRTPALVKRLGKMAGEVPEVRRVENLLHLPKTPAPTRSDTPAGQRKETGRRTRPRSAEVHLTQTVSAEVPTPVAEPGPAEVARQGRGRPASPLGSSDQTTAGDGETPEATPPSARSVDSVEKDPEPAKRA